MNILYFAVNSKHKKFFQKVKNLGCNGDIVESKSLWLPSLKAIKPKIDLTKAIELRVKDFKAKYGYKKFEPIIRAVYRVIAYINYIRYYRVIDSRYSHIMVWNSSLFRQSIAVDISKLYGIEPIVIESGLMPNRIVVDTKGANYLNSVPRSREFFENYQNNKTLPSTLIPRVPKNAKKFIDTPKIELPKEYIFVPFQVDYDTQILLFSPWIESMEELYNIIDEVSNILDINFILKEHPSSIKDYPQLHQRALQNSKISFANGHPTQELIEKSKAVITINSTVGIESLLFQKRVIVLGKAFYAIDGITKQANSKEELIDILSNLNSWRFNHNLVDNFLKYLYYEYLVSVDEIEKIKQKIQAP